MFYFGVGIGVVILYVEFECFEGCIFEYQLIGLVICWFVGVSCDFSDIWLGFVEYQGMFFSNIVDLMGGGKFDIDIIIYVVNIGLGYCF